MDSYISEPIVRSTSNSRVGLWCSFRTVSNSSSHASGCTSGDYGDRVVVGDFQDGLESSYGLDIKSDAILSRPSNAKVASLASPLEGDSSFILPDDLLSHLAEKNEVQSLQSMSGKDKHKRLPPKLDYIAYLVHFAVFGILGVFTRYLLQKLFGPNVLSLTKDDTPLYLDLPSNMLGSFLMGWFGIVLKGDLCHVSEHLAIGLTTGYLGSLTTFSGWNQKMLNLSSESHWTYAVAGIILGMFIVNECINVGVEFSGWLRRSFLKLTKDSEITQSTLNQLRMRTFKQHMIVMALMLATWCSFCVFSGLLVKQELERLADITTLWLGCLLGPVGVWVRWFLARLNGRGLGTNGSLQWLPIGTLLANFLAASLMAALSTISKAVNTTRCGLIISGVQFGFLGCMSTVSTFVAEVYAMRQSGHPGRAAAYATLTIFPSFMVGTLIYSVPVWTKHYN
ncbi:hypothetical protein HPP92_011772 [Vanilla planifolia]|uniref:CrcB-like protein n=1 Tax=Vanilla planifolia TaxID=51239 RepID=A0A835R4T6_VANPL|nr:hypothetical protein HPP92_011772 [Vanilla planifolia]